MVSGDNKYLCISYTGHIGTQRGHNNGCDNNQCVSVIDTLHI